MLKFIHAAVSLVLVALGQTGALDGLQNAVWWGITTAPATIMYVLAGVFLLAGILTYVRERHLASMCYFDVPIRDAIIHAANTTDHSYNTPSLRDRLFFERLHKDMCTGKLLVVGREGEFGALTRISKR